MSNDRNVTRPNDIQSTADIYAFALDELESDEPHTVGERASIFDSPKDGQADKRFGSKQPVGVVTSEDVQRMPRPVPVHVVNGRASGVRLAHGGEIRYRPRQPRGTFALIAGVVAAACTILFILYTSLIASGTIGEPAVLMYGASTNTGKIMQRAAEFDDAPQNQLERYKDQTLASSYVNFRTQVYDGMKPMFEAYALLGDELAKGGVPNIAKITELNNQAQAAAQTSQENLSQVAIPEGSGGDLATYLNKILLASNASIAQAINTSEAISRAAEGDASAFADAGLSAQNMIRNKENIFADFNRADKAIGLLNKDESSKEETAQ